MLTPKKERISLGSWLHATAVPASCILLCSVRISLERLHA